MTYDLDFQPQVSWSQGHDPYENSGSKVSRYKRQSGNKRTDRKMDGLTDGQTDGRTDGRTDATDCFVGKKERLTSQKQPRAHHHQHHHHHHHHWNHTTNVYETHICQPQEQMTITKKN